MSCAKLDDIYTLDYLVRTFKHRAKDVVEHTAEGLYRVYRTYIYELLH